MTASTFQDRLSSPRRVTLLTRRTLTARRTRRTKKETMDSPNKKNLNSPAEQKPPETAWFNHLPNRILNSKSTRNFAAFSQLIDQLLSEKYWQVMATTRQKLWMHFAKCRLIMSKRKASDVKYKGFSWTKSLHLRTTAPPTTQKLPTISSTKSMTTSWKKKSMVDSSKNSLRRSQTWLKKTRRIAVLECFKLTVLWINATWSSRHYW